MPQPTLTSMVQKLEIDNVGGVAVTDIAVDANGNAVREIRVTGVTDSDNPFPPLVFTLRLVSPAKANITLTTPTLSF